MQPFFTSAITAAVVCAFLVFLLGAAKRGQPEAEPGTGHLLFRHHSLMRWFAYFAAFGIPIGITALVIAFPPKDPGDTLAILGLYALFAMLSAPLLWESLRFALIVRPEGLECRSPWRGTQFFKWNEVEELSYSSLGSWFVIHAEGGRTFRVPVLTPGLNPLLEIFERHLPARALQRAKAGYAQIGRALPEAKSQ